MGARLGIATVSGPEKARLASAAGANRVVSYCTQDVAAVVREATGGQGFQRSVEVDLAANLASALALLATDGEIVAYGSGAHEVGLPFDPAIPNRLRLTFFIVCQSPPDVLRGRAIAELTQSCPEDGCHTVFAAFTEQVSCGAA